MEPEFDHLADRGSPFSGDFPAFSLVIRDSPGETSSLQTGSTAIQSAAAETRRLERGSVPQSPAVARGFGRGPRATRSGDCGCRAWKTPQPAIVSVAGSGASVSPPILTGVRKMLGNHHELVAIERAAYEREFGPLPSAASAHPTGK
jgi:hypothetical protein